MSGAARKFAFVLRQFAVPEGTPDIETLRRVARRLGCAEADILECRPVRRSRDARRRNKSPLAIYHFRIVMPHSWRKKILALQGVDIAPDPKTPGLFGAVFSPPAAGPGSRPLVVGAGPAGLFAALRLSREGWRPILVERGDPPEERRAKAAAFWRAGALDPDSNVLYGAGGAGLFSDGKLNTRHKDREGLREILSELVRAGAPEDLLLDAEPHIGSDLLGAVVERLSQTIVEHGGEILHRRRLVDLILEKNSLRAACLDAPGGAETLEARNCVLATGHSARDMYDLLSRLGAALEPKPFAVGFRVEMPQEAINASQRGDRPDNRFAASFRMARPPGDDARASYTFCMCPGGLVVPCASEPGHLAVNGMSCRARAGDWGNAAFLVPVLPGDFDRIPEGVPPALTGVSFQRRWESACFAAGLAGGAYAVPASRLGDFLSGKTGGIPVRRSVDRAVAADLTALLPPAIVRTLQSALPPLIGKLRRVDPDTVLLYASETRTSSPVRTLRSEKGESLGIAGIFPAGEGSGYAGGIMTSALDGWRAAEKLMRHAHGRR